MTKWTKTRRDPGRNYLDEERLQRTRRMLAQNSMNWWNPGSKQSLRYVKASKSGQPGDHRGRTEGGDYAVSRRCLCATARSISVVKFLFGLSATRSCVHFLGAPASIISLKRSRSESHALFFLGFLSGDVATRHPFLRFVLGITVYSTRQPRARIHHECTHTD